MRQGRVGAWFRVRLNQVGSQGLLAWQPLAVLSMTVLSLIGVLGSAVFGHRWVFLISVLVGVLVDQIAERLPLVQRLLIRTELGVVTRSIIREAGLLIILTRVGWSESWIIWTAVAIFLVILARAFVVVADGQATELQMPKILTRNLQVAEVEDVMPPPSLRPATLALIGSIPLVAGVIGLFLGELWTLAVAAGAYLVFAAGWGLWRVVSWLAATRRVSRTALIESVSEELRTVSPEVLVYFSGEPSALYQLEMWLPVLEQLGRPVLIVLREREIFEELRPTSLPVVCVPNASDLMDFRLPTVRVAMYVAHVGKNLHMLREPRMKHVFIGHGESDKPASLNPATKAMDEVWVAGRASRERWAAGKVGVRDETIVEVGRPQLGGILPAAPRTGRPLSVLYAPTWEGWVDDPGATSIISFGPRLVRWLTQRPDTRVIYRPHPLIGRVSGAARRAHTEVMSLIVDSGGRDLALGVASAQDWVEAQGVSLVVSGEQAPLFDCFNNCDLLIGDISSVVPDFQASGKPYIILNTRGLAQDELRAESASSRAAYLLDNDQDGWESLLSEILATDPLKDDRARMREFLIGPRYDDPLVPWREAVDDLIARANAEWPQAYQEVIDRT
jgi:hypothetical protein